MKFIVNFLKILEKLKAYSSSRRRPDKIHAFGKSHETMEKPDHVGFKEEYQNYDGTLAWFTACH